MHYLSIQFQSASSHQLNNVGSTCAHNVIYVRTITHTVIQLWHTKYYVIESLSWFMFSYIFFHQELFYYYWIYIFIYIHPGIHIFFFFTIIFLFIQSTSDLFKKHFRTLYRIWILFIRLFWIICIHFRNSWSFKRAYLRKINAKTLELLILLLIRLTHFKRHYIFCQICYFLLHISYFKRIFPFVIILIWSITSTVCILFQTIWYLLYIYFMHDELSNIQFHHLSFFFSSKIK